MYGETTVSTPPPRPLHFLFARKRGGIQNDNLEHDTRRVVGHQSMPTDLLFRNIYF